MKFCLALRTPTGRLYFAGDAENPYLVLTAREGDQFTAEGLGLAVHAVAKASAAGFAQATQAPQVSFPIVFEVDRAP